MYCMSTRRQMRAKSSLTSTRISNYWRTSIFCLNECVTSDTLRGPSGVFISRHGDREEGWPLSGVEPVTLRLCTRTASNPQTISCFIGLGYLAELRPVTQVILIHWLIIYGIQLLQCETWLFFLVLYDIELKIFGFCTRQATWLLGSGKLWRVFSDSL